MTQNLPPQYNPKEVEDKIYRIWEKSGYFAPEAHQPRADNPNSRKPFTIIMPPPNITGELHMGHALNAAIQDILIRKKRMEGYKTLWLPGTDHAGIATQNVVERELKKQGISRHTLGREKLLEKMWEWREKYGHIILDQLKKLGSSMDWSRTRFTMDPEYQEAVKTAFLHYYKKGWIYQGERVINWCPRCATSLSDLELEYKEVKGTLYYINYPLADGGGVITVATTRPETMLGDTAVAVNPSDARYKKLVGKKVVLPLKNRKIPVIADKAVDPEFGTGAVKVTPAHDLLDAEIAKRHKLPSIRIIGVNGKTTQEAEPICVGLTVGECRKKVLEELREKKFLEREEQYTHNVSICYRCGTPVEPMPSIQWFLKIDKLATHAVKAVKSGNVEFHPQRWEKAYFAWVKNVKDWCISRQIWWGHPIPAWRCGTIGTEQTMGFYDGIVPQIYAGKTRTYRLRDRGLKKGDIVALENSQTGEIFGSAKITEIARTIMKSIPLPDKKHGEGYKTVEELIAAFKRHNPDRAVTPDTEVFIYDFSFQKSAGCQEIIISDVKPGKCPKCGSTRVGKVTDVLDTWFSSALWPFATLGWPTACGRNQKSKTKNQKLCKPLPGSDLNTYYPTQILSTARDIINLWVARMIFSGIEFMGREPFKDVIIHATILTKDGKRMSKSLGTGVDPMDLILKYGADATRFGLIWQHMGNQDMHWSEEHVVAGKKFANKIWNAARFTLANLQPTTYNLQPRPKPKTDADKKVLAALEKTKKEVSARIERYEFGQPLHSLHNFYWHEFCDIYIEKSKAQMSDVKGQRSTRQILLYILAESLKLLHPFMPFITEEIWGRLPIKNKKLLIIEPWPK